MQMHALWTTVNSDFEKKKTLEVKRIANANL